MGNSPGNQACGIAFLSFWQALYNVSLTALLRLRKTFSGVFHGRTVILSFKIEIEGLFQVLKCRIFTGKMVELLVHRIEDVTSFS